MYSSLEGEGDEGTSYKSSLGGNGGGGGISVAYSSYSLVSFLVS